MTASALSPETRVRPLGESGRPARAAERPPLRQRTGATRFAVICAEELEALAILGGESGAALQVLAWLKCNLRGRTPYVEMPDTEIADRSGKSRNTVRGGIAALLRLGLIFDATPGDRRRGVHPRYEVAFPPQRIKAGPTWSDSEHVESEAQPTDSPDSEHVERKNWARQGQELSTRSRSREHGTEKSALPCGQQARSSVIQGSSGSLDLDGRCARCRESTMPGWVEVPQAGGTVGLSRCPGEEHRQALRPAVSAVKRRAASEGS